jgi:hypothetical protein
MFFDLNSLIQPTDLSHLDAPFSLAEIDKIVKELPVDKTPGPDGFNGFYIKKCWSLIKEDFYGMFTEFYNGLFDLRSINRSYITLVAQISSPSYMNDYSPISLLGDPSN